MAVYLDASAIVKLIVAEAESSELVRFLRKHPVRVTSALSHVEVLRAVRAAGEAAGVRARRALVRVQRLALDDEVLDAAARLDPVVLRSLDAIHVASALALGGDLELIVTYDRRMIAAVSALGLAVRAPGSPDDRALSATSAASSPARRAEARSTTSKRRASHPKRRGSPRRAPE